MCLSGSWMVGTQRGGKTTVLHEALGRARFQSGVLCHWPLLFSHSLEQHVSRRHILTSLLRCSSTTSTSPRVPVSTILTLHLLQSTPAYSFCLTSLALPQGGHLVHRLRDSVTHLITSKNITPALTAHPHLFLTRKRGCRCSSSRPWPQQ